MPNANFDVIFSHYTTMLNLAQLQRYFVNASIYMFIYLYIYLSNEHLPNKLENIQLSNSKARQSAEIVNLV